MALDRLIISRQMQADDIFVFWMGNWTRLNDVGQLH